MRRKLGYLIVIGAMLLVPAEGIDVGRLQPVEVVSILEREEGIRIQTDTGNVGRGMDLKEAYEDMKTAASGEVFLDTAEYLILEGEITDKEMLLRYFRPKTRVCKAAGEIDMEKAAQYLAVHKPEKCLKDINTGDELQELQQKGPGFSLS